MIPEANASHLKAPQQEDSPPLEGSEPRLGKLAKPSALSVGKVGKAGNEGTVRIVVSPWARVFVDGEFYDYTPFAAPIPLSPGEHTIGFRNPYYEAVDRVIVVESGKTQLLKQALLPKMEEGDAPPP